VVVIEHNMDLIKSADYVLDIGPEGGDGRWQACGQGYTGGGGRILIRIQQTYLRKVLRKSKKKIMKIVDLATFNLPDCPGVYYFLGENKEILYVGKATSLKDRGQELLHEGSYRYPRGALCRNG